MDSAREHAVACRRADGGSGVCIGEAHPLRCELVEVRRAQRGLCIVTLRLAVAQVIEEDENDVGLRRKCRMTNEIDERNRASVKVVSWRGDGIN